MYNPANLLIVTSGRIDTVDDAEPGSAIANPVEPRLGGVLGGFLPLTKPQAAQLSSPSVPLFEGVYQYVKFKAGTTAAPTRGFIYYWDDFDDFIVTCDAPADARHIAGIGLLSNTRGNFGFIQMAGRAQVKMTTSVTSTVIGNPVFAVDDSNLADALAIATAWTGGHMTRWIGRAAETLVNSAVNQVLLQGLYINQG